MAPRWEAYFSFGFYAHKVVSEDFQRKTMPWGWRVVFQCPLAPVTDCTALPKTYLLKSYLPGPQKITVLRERVFKDTIRMR